MKRPSLTPQMHQCLHQQSGYGQYTSTKENMHRPRKKNLNPNQVFDTENTCTIPAPVVKQHIYTIPATHSYNIQRKIRTKPYYSVANGLVQYQK